jgi:hypothetical protein
MSDIQLAAPPSTLLWLLALYQGEIDFPQAALFPPADRQPPEQRFHTQHLLILSLISFNRVGQKPYDKPQPADLHRFLTPGSKRCAHHRFVRFLNRDLRKG